MNDYLFEWPSCKYVWVCIYPCARMCEKNLKDICPSVHVYMQIGVYITLIAYVCIYVCMCGSVYVNTYNIWMMLVC